LVKVPFRNREILGIVLEQVFQPENIHKIKNILLKYDKIIENHTLEFIQKSALYTFAPQGEVLRSILSGAVLDKKPKEIVFDSFENNLSVLNESQESAYLEIKNLFLEEKFTCALLDGITGSGKTEVYFHLILDALKKNQQILVLQPEISLSTSWIKRFEKAFGIKPLVWHSKITPAGKRDLWEWSLSGKPGVLVGARSALFLPFKGLKLIIVDEEHDGSYKQEEQFIYHGRDMAVMRAYIEKCPILLASATPSIETYLNVQNGKYKSIALDSRFQDAVLPDIELIDLNESPAENSLSDPLFKKLEETFHKGEQSLLFLNKKGYASLTICKECNTRISCPNCALYLVEHKFPQRLICHHCGFTRKYPKICIHCKAEDSHVPWGPGIDRLEEELIKRFPNARIKAISGDDQLSPKEWEDLLNKISGKEFDIVLATQILAKGHHFPKLTFIGVIDGDFSLNCLDLRASERTFQLLSQVSGRAGREGGKSLAMIQTHDPSHPVLKAFCAFNRDDFLAHEIKSRLKQNLPPFSHYVALIFSSEDRIEVEHYAKKISTQLYEKFRKDLTILGPIIAPIAFLRKRHRYRILLKSPKNPLGLQDLRVFLLSLKIPSKIILKIDVDPYHFL
jgi:primosomal protein N' (replication factor Y)